jgi:hypothetical protein
LHGVATTRWSGGGWHAATNQSHSKHIHEHMRTMSPFRTIVLMFTANMPTRRCYSNSLCGGRKRRAGPASVHEHPCYYRQETSTTKERRSCEPTRRSLQSLEFLRLDCQQKALLRAIVQRILSLFDCHRTRYKPNSYNGRAIFNAARHKTEYHDTRNAASHVQTYSLATALNTSSTHASCGECMALAVGCITTDSNTM